MRHYAALSREQIRDTFAAFCDARPVGGKFAHRACDGPAGSSPSMKWVNPPVAYMLHAGVPLLIDAGVHLPGLHAGDPTRVALEGYPGLLARELLGRALVQERRQGEADARAPDRPQGPGRCARAGPHAGSACACALSHAQRDALVADASGDRLDAVLCLLQAAWARTQPGYGLPRGCRSAGGLDRHGRRGVSR